MNVFSGQIAGEEHVTQAIVSDGPVPEHAPLMKNPALHVVLHATHTRSAVALHGTMYLPARQPPLHGLHWMF